MFCCEGERHLLKFDILSHSSLLSFEISTANLNATAKTYLYRGTSDGDDVDDTRRADPVLYSMLHTYSLNCGYVGWPNTHL